MTTTTDIRVRRGPRRLIVNSPRNSYCSAPLNSLDWGRWFTDGRGADLYLHFWSKDGETIHRVHCKHSDSPRLECQGAVLRWLIDAS